MMLKIIDTLTEIFGILFLVGVLLNVTCIVVLGLFGVNLIEVLCNWLKGKRG